MAQMTLAVVTRFGGPEVIEIQTRPVPTPGPGQVLVRMTSVGMNQAEVMARKGEYKLSSGEPPFVPGIEGGGVVEGVGTGVTSVQAGHRVILIPGAPRRDPKADGVRDYLGGTYRSHYLCDQAHVMAVPDGVPDDLIGALWLPYLTAWGCLVWKQRITKGMYVGIPGCSSSVGIAAAQVARDAGAIPIGLTTSPSKVEVITRELPGLFEQLVVTHHEGTMVPWHRTIKDVTAGHGMDVYFDPVAAGEYLSIEVRSLAQSGTIWVYGLLGKADVVDVQPLIRKYGSIRGWLLFEMVSAGPDVWKPACEAILDRVASGKFVMPVAGRFALKDAAKAQMEMEKAGHVGKFVIVG
jgi:NADPH:quinone reductase